MPWLQLFIPCPKQEADALEHRLLDLGALSVTLREHIPEGEEENPILEPGLNETPLWDEVTISGLFDANCHTGKINKALAKEIDPKSLRWEQLEDKDWEREWMSNYHPIHVSDGLWVCPSWCEPPEPEAVNIMLDPGLAFGTGTHPTTFLCMQWLAKQDLRGKTLVDFGCGSGILGVTALKLGADKVIGIDIDPQALQATRENALRNHLEAERFPVYLPQDKALTEALEAHKIEMVVANILAGPLTELRDAILAPLKQGDRFCLSGILHNQADTVMAAYKDHADFDPVTQKEDWVVLSGVIKY